MSQEAASIQKDTKKGATMIAIGQLLTTLTPNVIASVVEGETTVPWTLLLENDDFLDVIRKADKIEEVVDWVNENY
jgi:hypothetical protein